MGSLTTSPVTDAGGNATIAPPEMQWIPEGTFLMGSNDHYPEERLAHPVRVSGFWIDRAPITNAQFEAFVNATGFVSFAEIPPRAADYPGALPDMLRPGSMVFAKATHRVDIRDCHNWWAYRFGADWRHPEGAESSLEGREDHPVVHVTAADAEAYAQWAGKALPTEAEWERAARGGLEGVAFAWGDEFLPSNRHMANTWQGEFPWQNLATDGYEGTSPIGAFPANGYGLVDMIGNVWEWTADWFVPHGAAHSGKACCVPSNPRGGTIDASYEAGAHIKIPRRVLKGGSHLCAPNYCRRYRPAARFAQPIDTSTGHVGFRCVLRPADQA